MVSLCVGLYMLGLPLARRSSTLRTYAGDTSLPGGKVDPSDETLEDTAVRSSFFPFIPSTEPFYE